MYEINPMYQTPNLTTASTVPLHLLEKKLLDNQQIIEHWFQMQWQNSTGPVYGSVDLRNAGFKLAPVDMNLFPAGFNNLNPDFLPLSVEAAKIAIQYYAPSARKIILIPESHTRNLFYWENIYALLNILKEGGFDIRVGSLLPDYPTATPLELANGKEVLVESLQRENDLIKLKNFEPDFILLNNDLSDGIPEILKNLNQPILPPAKLGWSHRLKSNHFQYYAEVSQEFAKIIDIDAWLIDPLFRHCGEVDFMKRESEDCLASSVEQLLTTIEKKYQEYEIACKPFVVIKADAGTYGMAVMTVRSVEEVKAMNRKQRTSMSKSKGGRPVHKVIMQEGVYTFETWKENAVAEPVVYLWGQRVVGGFYRVHQERGIDENLNSPGMKFEPLAFASACQKPEEGRDRFYAYGVIARLSMLAAAREILMQS